MVRSIDMEGILDLVNTLRQIDNLKPDYYSNFHFEQATPLRRGDCMPYDVIIPYCIRKTSS